MFLDWKNQYCENNYTTQSNLQIQTILIKLLIALFIELEQKNFTIHMEIQKTPNSQSIIEKEEWS